MDSMNNNELMNKTDNIGGAAPVKKTLEASVNAEPHAAKTAVFSASGIETAAALISYVFAYCYVRFPLFSGRFTLAIFALAFAVGTELFMRAMKKPKPTAESLFWLAVLLVVSGSGALFGNETLSGGRVLLSHGLAVYWALCRAGILAEGETGRFILRDAVSGAIVIPFDNFFLRIKTIAWQIRQRRFEKAVNSDTEKTKERKAVLLTALAALPVFALAVVLLVRADAKFESVFDSLFSFDFDIDLSFLLTFLFSLPVGCYLYGLVGGSARMDKSLVDAAKARENEQRLKAAPASAVKVIVAAFLLIYALFLALQGSYLFGALRGTLPSGFTPAEYARRGFFELCGVVVLNFSLLFLTSRFCKASIRNDAVLKTEALLLMLANLLFAAVAGSKMYLYVSRFGLTGDRVLSSFVMLVLFLSSILAAADVLKPFAAYRAAIMLAAALFCVLCLCDLDARITNCNFSLYESGKVSELDVAYLRAECGAAKDADKYLDRLESSGWLSKADESYEFIDAFGYDFEETSGPDGEYDMKWTLGDQKVTARFDENDRLLSFEKK